MAVPWTKPDYLVYGPDRPLPRFTERLRGGFNAVFADGRIRTILNGLKEPILRALITRNGGEDLSPDALPRNW